MQGSARGEERRREIVSVALDLVVERGFGALTLDEVARSAGASKTTLMRFFGGRQGLLEATLTLEMELVFEPLERAAGDLSDFGAAVQDVVFSPRCLRLLRYVLSAGDGDPAPGETFRTVVLGRLEDLVRPAMAATLGLPPRRREVTVAVERYLGDLLGLEVLRALSGGDPDRRRLAAYRDRAVAAAAR